MKVSIIVATFGEPWWNELAHTRAAPSAFAQEVSDEVEVDVVIVHGESLAHARNFGAEQAGGDWLVFLDADDRLDAHYVSAMTDAVHLQDDPARLLYVPAVAYGANRPRVLPMPGDGDVMQRIMVGNWMVIGTMVHRTQFWAAGGFGDEPAWEDWSLWMRTMLNGARPVIVPGAVYRATVSPDGRNSTVANPRRLQTQIRERNLRWFRQQEASS